MCLRIGMMRAMTDPAAWPYGLMVCDFAGVLVETDAGAPKRSMSPCSRLA
jgi:hypothetical protein